MGLGGHGGIVGNKSCLCAQHSRHCLLLVPAFASISFCLCHVPVNSQQFTCHENHTATRNYPSSSYTKTIWINTHAALDLLYTCLGITSAARAKSHWLLPLLMSRAGDPYGEGNLIDWGGPELHRGPVTWQGLDIYYVRPGVSCWHRAQNSSLCLWLQDHMFKSIFMQPRRVRDSSRFSCTKCFRLLIYLPTSRLRNVCMCLNCRYPCQRSLSFCPLVSEKLAMKKNNLFFFSHCNTRAPKDLVGELDKSLVNGSSARRRVCILFP